MSTVQAPAAGRAAPGQTRARYPDAEGYVERDGVRVFWERYGDGEPTVFLLPTWSIIHSRLWKAQIPYLARHYRVLTSDGRGNGRWTVRRRRRLHRTGARGRCPGRAGRDRHQAGPAGLALLRGAVVDAAGGRPPRPRRRARPHRTGGRPGPAASERAVHSFHEPLDTDEGWARYNQHYWLRDYRGFLEYFFSRCLTEPHSTKQHEDCVGWALEMAPETLIDTEEGLLLCGLESFERQCRRVRCPVLVLHGDEDAIRPHAQGAALAAATGGRLITLAGAGHLPQARDPVKVNLCIREFVDTLGGMAG